MEIFLKLKYQSFEPVANYVNIQCYKIHNDSEK